MYITDLTAIIVPVLTSQHSVRAFLEVSSTVTSRIPLTLHEFLEPAHASPRRPTDSQRLQSIVHEDPYESVVVESTFDPLSDHPRGKRYQLRGYPRPLPLKLCGVKHRILWEGTNRRKRGDHEVVVCEIYVHGSIEREGFGRRVQRSIRLRVVADGLTGQTCQEFIDVAHALNSSQWIAVSARGDEVKEQSGTSFCNKYPPCTIEFGQISCIFIGTEFLSCEEAAEWAPRRDCDRLEGAKRHEIVSLSVRFAPGAPLFSLAVIGGA